MRAAVIVVAVALAYANSFWGPLILDDQLTITQNRQIRSTRLSEILSPERELPVAGRPLVNASFALNYAIGGTDVTGYHVVNVTIHIGCALLLFGLLCRALALPRAPRALADPAQNLALFTALLWGVHPLNTEAVNYITQRTELMMAFFYLLTLYASVRTIKVRATGTGSRVPLGDPLWFAIAVLSCAAGMACKESMVTAPVMVVIVDGVLVFGSLAAALRHRWRLYACLAATWGVPAALLSSGPRVHSAGLAAGVSPWRYLLNQPEIIADYLKHTVWPRDLVALYGWPVHVSIGDMWPYGLVVALLLAATVVALATRPALGLLGAWFFITLAPASSVVPIATEVGADRRMYLPLMALVVLAVVGVWRAFEFLPTARVRATGFAILPIVVALGATTYARNRDYESPLRLAQDSLEARPNDMARHFLGVSLANAGRTEDGLEMLRLATATNPRAFYDLGMVHYAANHLDESVAALEEFARRQPALVEVVTARLTICHTLAQQSQWEPAARQCRDVLRMSPSNGEAIRLLVFSLSNHGIALVTAGRIADAVNAFLEAVALDPVNPDAQRNLAVAYVDLGERDLAAQHARTGLALRPDDQVMRDVLTQAAARGGPAGAGK